MTKNTKKIKSNKDRFEITFILVSILMFILLVSSIIWLKNSLYTAKDQVASSFVNDYQKNLMVENVDPFVTNKGVSDNLRVKPTDNDKDPALGERNAKVKIFYFSDFSCPFCLEQEKVIKKVYDKFKEDVRIIWKDYPDLSSLQSFSYRAAKAGRCAHEQGKFWDYNILLYEQKDLFDSLKDQLFINLADNIKLNINSFTSCLAKPEINENILNNVYEAEDLGIVGIPYIYINDIDVLGDVGEKELESMIKTELNK